GRGTLVPQAAEDEKHARELSAADPALYAVQHEALTVRRELGRQRSQRAAGAGLGEGEGPDRLPLCDLRQPCAFLFLRPPLEQRHRHHGLNRDHAGERGGPFPEGLVQRSERRDVPALPAVLARQRVANETAATE